MDTVKYVIKEIEDVPTIIAEIYSENKLVVDYQVSIPENMNKLEIPLLEEYSSVLSEKFDKIILEIKNSGTTYDSFSINIARISKILEIKKICDNYIERMDIIE